jgi:hypothetical protein
MLAEVGSRLKPEWSHSCRNTSWTWSLHRVRPKLVARSCRDLVTWRSQVETGSPKLERPQMAADTAHMGGSESPLNMAKYESV